MSAKDISQPPYPTASHVASTITQTSNVADLDNLRRLFAPHCECHVMGQEHFLSGPRSDGESWVQHLQAIASIFDEESYKLETIHAFGGGEEPWVCYEAKSVAKTKEGKSLLPQRFLRLPSFSYRPPFIHSYVRVSLVLAYLLHYLALR